MSHSQNSPTRITAVQRRIQALELRIAGKNFREIGLAMGFSEQRAHQLVSEELIRLNAERSEAAVEVKRLELERLDALLAGVWEKAKGGDGPTIDRVIAIMQRRAKLQGLDAPTKSVVAGSGAFPPLEELSDDELNRIAQDEVEGGGGTAPPAEGADDS